MIMLLFLGLIALSVAGFIAYCTRKPSQTRIEVLRVKWLFIAGVVWGIGARGLSTDVTNACHTVIDPFRRGGAGDNFIACSPKLLASGPADIFAFVWLWAPLLLAAFFGARILIRTIRARSDSKESK